jgi:hypothetical protein
MVKNIVFIGVFVWLASTLYVLVSWDFSPDRFLQWAAAVICVGGIVLGVIAAVLAIVTGVWSGHKEKKQWE